MQSFQRILVSSCLAFAGASLSAPSAAQSPPAERFGERIESQAPPKPLPPEPPRAPGDPPAAQTGFQLGFRSGVSLPAGSISDADGNGLSDQSSAQVPLLLELGAKPTRWLFVGAYGGVGFGGVSDTVDKNCNAVGVSCSSRSLRVGVEALVYLLPGAWVDPWVGYGIGYESLTLVGETDKAFSTQSVSGLELGHFMAGADLRLSHTFGVGPYIDFAVGRYTSFHADPTDTNGNVDRDIEKRAFHEWITLGARLVAFP